MKRAWLLLLTLAGCNNFDALVERCLAEGRCGDGGTLPAGDPGVLSASPTMLTLSSAISDSSDPAMVTIENTGPGSVDNLVVSALGVDASDFALLSNCPLTLAAHQTCTLTVTFTPRPMASATRAARIELLPSRGDKFTVALQGTALPGLEAPTTVEFNDVTTGTSAMQMVTLRNPARMPRVVVASTAAPFSVVTNGCATVGPGLSCVIAVQYAPVMQGQNEGLLDLSLQNSTFTLALPLHGRGVAPSVLRIEPSMPFNGDHVDAGATLDRPFTVRNTGTQTIGPLVPSVPDSGFSLVSTTCGLLDAGDTCGGVLRFAPPAFGTYAGQLDVAAGAAGTAMAALVGNASAVFSLSVGLSRPDSGVSVAASSVLAGKCFTQCTASAFVTPSTVPTIALAAARTRRVDHLGWVGDCTAIGDGGCTVVLDGNKAVSAQFDAVPVAFLTDGWIVGNMGGREGGDAFCRASARDAGLTGTFIALLSVPDAGAIERLPDVPGWVVSDGKTLVMSRGDLRSRTFVNTLDRTERGQVPQPISGTSGYFVWSGTLDDGGTGNSCQGWTSGTPEFYTAVALPADGPHNFFNDTWQTGPYSYCYFQNRLHCFQTDARGRALPPDPLPSDAGYRVFVAFGMSDGGSTTGARRWFDDVCLTAAQSQGYPGNYKAMVSTYSPAAPASQRVGYGTLSGPVYRPDGVLVWTNIAAIDSVAPLNPVDIAIFSDGGIGQVDVEVSTGSSGFSQYPSTPADTCHDWADDAGVAAPTYAGVSGSASWFWRSSPTPIRKCAPPYPFYCLAAP